MNATFDGLTKLTIRGRATLAVFLVFYAYSVHYIKLHLFVDNKTKYW